MEQQSSRNREVTFVLGLSTIGGLTGSVPESKDSPAIVGRSNIAADGCDPTELASAIRDLIDISFEYFNFRKAPTTMHGQHLFQSNT